MTNKRTSPTLATKAANALNDGRTSATTKALAASILSQTGDNSSTSSKVASKASDVLSNPQSSVTAKSLAGSALAQSK